MKIKNKEPWQAYQLIGLAATSLIITMLAYISGSKAQPILILIIGALLFIVFYIFISEGQKKDDSERVCLTDKAKDVLSKKETANELLTKNQEKVSVFSIEYALNLDNQEAAEAYQKNCHEFVKKVIELNPSISVQDATNVWLFSELAKLQSRINWRF